MEENKDYNVKKAGVTEQKRRFGFLRDFISGICIGVAFIIPGFSGGSVAAMLGIYEKLINAIANIFKEMKKSIITLLPIGLGLAAGIALLIFPLGFMLERFPLPTVSLFVGLAIGSIPSLFERVKGRPSPNNIIALSIPLVLVFLMSFAPIGGEVDLFNLGFGGYIILFLIGVLGSCALVVPGISGSMLLLMLGYYNPLVRLITDHLLKFRDLGVSVLVLGTCALGISVGFILISKIMKYFLAKYHKSTYYAIIGFIIGSIPTVYFTTLKDAGMMTHSFELISIPSSPLHYVICVFLVLMGICAACGFANIAEKKAE